MRLVVSSRHFHTKPNAAVARESIRSNRVKNSKTNFANFSHVKNMIFNGFGIRHVNGFLSRQAVSSPDRNPENRIKTVQPHFHRRPNKAEFPNQGVRFAVSGSQKTSPESRYRKFSRKF